MPTAHKGSMTVVAALVLGSLVLSGCASQSATKNDPKQGANFSHELYDGKPTMSLSGDFPPASVDEAVVRGDQAYLKGDSDLALYEYLRGLSLPDVGDKAGPIYYKVGYIHEQKHNSALAQRAYQQAVLVAPDNPAYVAALGIVQLKQGQREQAEEHLMMAIRKDQSRQGVAELASDVPLDWSTVKLDSQSPQLAYISLAIIDDLNGEHASAQALFNQVLAFNPRARLAMLNLGYSLYMDGDLAGAEAMTKRAIALDGSDPRGWSNLGLILSRQHRFDDAIEVFSRVMPVYQALNDTGYLAMLDGEYAVAVNYLQQAIDVCPTYYPKAQGNLKRARKLLNSGGPLSLASMTNTPVGESAKVADK